MSLRSTVGAWVDEETGALLPVGERYERRCVLGRGGMGEVWRVWDRHLQRTVALKEVRAELPGSAQQRFLAEARATAALQHPGIVPIYELHQEADGRLSFTMREIEGRDLGRRLQEGEATPLRRRLEQLARVAEAVGYAHSRGVLHRDLKPGNIMVGEHGEVLVVDWGVASLAQEASPGAIVGTRRYMAPEQLKGEQLSPAADVFSLGLLLVELLGGDFSRQAEEVLLGPLDPPELSLLVRRCLSPSPADRPADGSALAALLTDWLDGARRREEALALVSLADQRSAEAGQARRAALACRAEAEARLKGLPPWAPLEEKLEGWRAEDEAAARDADVARLVDEQTTLLRGALEQVPRLPEAMDRLADHFAARHRDAEARLDGVAAAEAEARLREVDLGRYAAWLEGSGTLHLETEPAGAWVELHRYVLRQRRFVAEPLRALGPSPLQGLPLPMGSYLLRVSALGRQTVDYPLRIDRQQPWIDVPPGADRPLPLCLPREGELSEAECFIPGGWFWSGSRDPGTTGRLPPQRIWLDSFVMRRYPVTNAEYLVFLNALVAVGRGAEAREWVPQTATASGGVPVYGIDEQGLYHLRPDAEGDEWGLRWPVYLISSASAEAFAHWEADRTGLPWRLPTALEREKAARGVDGRPVPWGEQVDPTFCNTRNSGPRPFPAAVDAYPLDRSPYGVVGLAGNFMDWTSTPFRPLGPPIVDGRPTADPPAAQGSREARGSAWTYTTAMVRSENRYGVPAGDRRNDLGFRLCRSLRSPEPLESP